MWMTEQIIVSAITAVGVVFVAIMGYFTHRHARDINDAVNHRHTKTDANGNMPPKLYDLVISNAERAMRLEDKVDGLTEWRHGYDRSAFPNAEAIDEFVKRVDGLECRYEKCKGNQ